MKLSKMTDLELANEIARVEELIAAIEARDRHVDRVSTDDRKYQRALIAERERRDDEHRGDEHRDDAHDSTVFSETPRGHAARERWARTYDDLNGAPEDDGDR